MGWLEATLLTMLPLFAVSLAGIYFWGEYELKKQRPRNLTFTKRPEKIFSAFGDVHGNGKPCWIVEASEYDKLLKENQILREELQLNPAPQPTPREETE